MVHSLIISITTFGTEVNVSFDSAWWKIWTSSTHFTLSDLKMATSFDSLNRKRLASFPLFGIGQNLQTNKSCKRTGIMKMRAKDTKFVYVTYNIL